MGSGVRKGRSFLAFAENHRRLGKELFGKGPFERFLDLLDGLLNFSDHHFDFLVIQGRSESDHP